MSPGVEIFSPPGHDECQFVDIVDQRIDASRKARARPHGAARGDQLAAGVSQARKQRLAIEIKG
ncbi:hypothetical protein [Stappia sediminis]|uniref:hypothetical protein n=1 Tax=Stappia sediminis TaxID=2692190 RepID=UPI001AD8A6C5|nr:hypothetical protein [Stappia sediminis]